MARKSYLARSLERFGLPQFATNSSRPIDGRPRGKKTTRATLKQTRTKNEKNGAKSMKYLVLSILGTYIPPAGKGTRYSTRSIHPARVEPLRAKTEITTSQTKRINDCFCLAEYTLEIFTRGCPPKYDRMPTRVYARAPQRTHLPTPLQPRVRPRASRQEPFQNRAKANLSLIHI